MCLIVMEINHSECRIFHKIRIVLCYYTQIVRYLLIFLYFIIYPNKIISITITKTILFLVSHNFSNFFNIARKIFDMVVSILYPIFHTRCLLTFQIRKFCTSFTSYHLFQHFYLEVRLRKSCC